MRCFVVQLDAITLEKYILAMINNLFHSTIYKKGWLQYGITAVPVHQQIDFDPVFEATARKQQTSTSTH